MFSSEAIFQLFRLQPPSIATKTLASAILVPQQLNRQMHRLSSQVRASVEPIGPAEQEVIF